MSDKPPGWVPDPGLDAQSVAGMTSEEAKEYLTLLIRYFPPLELPSLRWLRRAAAASRGGGSQSRSQPGSGSSTPNAPQSSDAANPETWRDVLHPLSRKFPVDFEAPPSP